MKHVFCGGILLAMVSLAGCTGNSCSGCIASVFQGFNLVAEYPIGSKIPDIDPHHTLPLPTVFERGRIYVFQSIGPITTERVAIEVFPARLRKCSALIIERPRNPGDFLVPNIGGPRWNIRFRSHHCVGHLYNRYDPKLEPARVDWPSGAHDDYILEISAPQS